MGNNSSNEEGRRVTKLFDQVLGRLAPSFPIKIWPIFKCFKIKRAFQVAKSWRNVKAKVSGLIHHSVKKLFWKAFWLVLFELNMTYCTYNVENSILLKIGKVSHASVSVLISFNRNKLNLLFTCIDFRKKTSNETSETRN